MDLTKLASWEYYRINGTKKVLYWDGEKWMKPERDNRGSFGTYNSQLSKQPTNIKSVELVDIRTI